MWLIDLQKAIDILINKYRINCCISRIENGMIYLTDFTCYSIEKLCEETY